VRDHDGQKLAYVYTRKSRGRDMPVPIPAGQVTSAGRMV
jgi:hypothetical protein